MRRWFPRLLILIALLIVLIGVLLAACDVNAAERNNTGVSFYNQGNDEAALDAYQSAMVAAPDQPEAYFNAGSALSNVGRVQTAEAALHQALKTADEDLTAKAYYNLGNIYFDMAQYQQAVDAYRETLLLRPDDENARYNYELALRRLATPPPQEDNQQDEQESEAGPTPTPTPDPGGNEPEETGEPQGESPSGEGEESGTPTPQSDGPLTMEQAEQLLDAVQQNQETLGEYSDRTVPQVETPERDW